MFRRMLISLLLVLVLTVVSVGSVSAQEMPGGRSAHRS